jgi:hypothetical protein
MSARLSSLVRLHRFAHLQGKNLKLLIEKVLFDTECTFLM